MADRFRRFRHCQLQDDPLEIAVRTAAMADEDLQAVRALRRLVGSFAHLAQFAFRCPAWHYWFRQATVLVVLRVACSAAALCDLPLQRVALQIAALGSLAASSPVFSASCGPRF